MVFFSITFYAVSSNRNLLHLCTLVVKETRQRGQRGNKHMLAFIWALYPNACACRKKGKETRQGSPSVCDNGIMLTSSN